MDILQTQAIQCYTPLRKSLDWLQRKIGSETGIFEGNNLEDCRFPEFS